MILWPYSPRVIHRIPSFARPKIDFAAAYVIGIEMLTSYEFTIFILYLFSLASFVTIVYILNPGRAIREAMDIRYQETNEKFVNLEWEEPDSDEEIKPFDPAKEDYTMTENPMLRHRNKISEMEMVD